MDINHRPFTFKPKSTTQSWCWQVLWQILVQANPAREPSSVAQASLEQSGPPQCCKPPSWVQPGAPTGPGGWQGSMLCPCPWLAWGTLAPAELSQPLCVFLSELSSPEN